MDLDPSRSPRAQRLLALTVVIVAVAWFGAVFVADGVPRLVLGGLGLVFALDVVREVRKPGDIEQRHAKFDEPAAGPWLAGMSVFVVLNAIALINIRDRIHDDAVAFLLYGFSFAITFGIGQLVRAAVSRLPRYQPAVHQR